MTLPPAANGLGEPADGINQEQEELVQLVGRQGDSNAQTPEEEASEAADEAQLEDRFINAELPTETPPQSESDNLADRAASSSAPPEAGAKMSGLPPGVNEHELKMLADVHKTNDDLANRMPTGNQTIQLKTELKDVDRKTDYI